MTRDDAVRSVNAWLREAQAEARDFAERHPECSADDVDAFVKDRLVRTAPGYGLALTDDGGEALP